MHSKENIVPDIPKDITLESISQWRYFNQFILQLSPWSISQISIHKTKGIKYLSTVFWLRTSIFSKHCIVKLTTNKLTSIIKEFESMVLRGHGVSLFIALFDELLLQTTNKILGYVEGLHEFIYKTWETANELEITYLGTYGWPRIQDPQWYSDCLSSERIPWQCLQIWTLPRNSRLQVNSLWHYTYRLDWRIIYFLLTPRSFSSKNLTVLMDYSVLTTRALA